MNCIKIFQNAQDLSVSAGNTYPKDQLMQTFLDNFHQGGKYSAQIARHQAELEREENLFHPYRLIISVLTVAQIVVKIMR